MTKDFNEQNEDKNQNYQTEPQEQDQYDDQNTATNQSTSQEQESSNTQPIPEPQKRSGFGFLIFIIVVAIVIVIGFKEHLIRFFEEFTHQKPHQEITKTIQHHANNKPLPSQIGTPEDANHTPSANETLTPQEKQQIENIVREFIQKNPNIILDSLKNMEQQVAKERSVKAQDYIKSNINTITDNKPYLGNKNGSIVITKFFDYKCGYCKKAHAAIETLIKNTPDLKVVLVELPIMGQQSLIATQASLAVFNTTPTKFAKFNTDLMNTSNIDENTIKALATQNNINAAALMTAMKSPKVEQEIDSNMSIAREVGLQGVPAFIVGDEFIPGFVDYDTLKSKITKLQRQYTRP